MQLCPPCRVMRADAVCSSPLPHTPALHASHGHCIEHSSAQWCAQTSKGPPKLPAGTAAASQLVELPSIAPLDTPSTGGTGAEQIAAFFARSKAAAQEPILQHQPQQQDEGMPGPGPVADQAGRIFAGSLALGGVRLCAEALGYTRRWARASHLSAHKQACST